MGGMRMTGLISGMDTESMVQELVKASSTKVDNIKKDKQKLEWKKEAWQDLNTKIYNFFKTEVAALKTNGSFNVKKATSSNENKVSISAGSGASNGSHSVSVKQLASSAYLTGTNIKLGGGSYSSYENAGASTNFADMTDATGNSLNLSGKTIMIDNGDVQKTFELGGSGENGIASIEDLNKKLAEDDAFKGLKASLVDGKVTFTNTSATKKDDVEVGTNYVVSSDALGISGAVSWKADEETGRSTALSGTELGAKYKKDFTSNDINKRTKLADIGINVGTRFSIGDKDFYTDENTSIEDFTSALSKMGVSANFDVNQGRFYINASGTGEKNDFTLESSDSSALDKLGLGNGATKVDAQDAIIAYNGVEYTGDSNTFNLNGLSITAKSVTGTYNKENGTFTDDSPINVEVSADTDKAYGVVKDFVKKYNELIDEMNKLYSESKTDYEPLTDEEKKSLSETQIEQWEKKAKQGLLKRDSTINNLLTNMRSILNTSVNATLSDGSEKSFTLASLGIVTGEYSEKGKLHIVGDPDDAAYASETNKLKEALEKNPEVFSQVFAGTKDSQGIGYQLYDSLSKAMKKTESSSSLTFYNDITMKKEVDDYDDEIDKWADKLKKLEDKYYKQFGAMESAMAKLQSQQSYISQLMGGM